MSRKVPALARGALVALALAIEAFVVSLFIRAAADGAGIAEAFATGGGIAALALHLFGAIFLAAACGGFLPGGRTADRASFVVFYFIVAFVLPGFGALGVAALTAVLRSGIEAEGEPDFMVGNPLLEDAAPDGPPELHLEPLAAGLGSLELPKLRGAALALRHRAAHPGPAALLRRFRNDPDSELQFYAANALAAATESAEARLATLAAHVADHPDDLPARADLAEALLDAPAPSPAERASAAAAALEQLAGGPGEPGPRGARSRRLAARAHLAAGGDPAAARAALGEERAESDPAGENLELLFREGRWGALARLCRGAVPPPSAAAARFWAGAENAASKP